MSVDFNKYTAEEQVTKKQWRPPVSEQAMNHKSKKLALSTRCYPEYLLAALAYLEQHCNCAPESISDLMYKIVCEFINQNMEDIGELPDAMTAVKYFTMKEWMSVDTKNNFQNISEIEERSQKLEQAMAEGRLSLKEQYEYWKLRDPEKAKAIMDEMQSQLAESLETAYQEDEKKESGAYKPSDKNEEVVKRGMSYADLDKPKKDNIAGDIPDSLPIAEEEED